MVLRHKLCGCAVRGRVLFWFDVLIEHVQNAALMCRFRLVVGRVGLTVARATSRHFVWHMQCHLFRWIKLLSNLQTGSAADRAAETVDVGMLRVLHRFFVRSNGEYRIELVRSL